VALDGQQGDDFRFLAQGVDETGEGDGNLVVVAIEELLVRNLAIGRVCAKGTGSRTVKSAMTFLPSFSQRMRSLRPTVTKSASGEVCADLAGEVGVERSAEALVGGDHEHQLAVALAMFEQRVGLLAEVRADVEEHLGEALGIFAAGQRLVLRLLHLRGRDKLHRAGDLRGVLDRFDAAADVAEVGHAGLRDREIGYI
jgi:hypothetical protein